MMEDTGLRSTEPGWSSRSTALPILQGAEPFSADGDSDLGRVGILISHGFTGTPASVAGWAKHLAAAGYSVRVPLLPGHGTSWQDMNTTGWPDWYGELERAYASLSAQCDQVVLMGLSMGGTLVTRLAEQVGDAVAGLVLVNASYGTKRRDARVARFVAPLLASRPGIGSDIKLQVAREPGYDRVPLRAFVSLQQLWKLVVADLAKVKAPVLYFHSTEDHVVDELSGQLLHAGATSTTVTEIALPNSYHVATLDNDAPQIFQTSAEFVGRVTRTGVTPQMPSDSATRGTAQ
jgi:carboxylesterase